MNKSHYQLVDYNNVLVVVDDEGNEHKMPTRDLPPEPFYSVIMAALMKGVGASSAKMDAESKKTPL